MKTKKNKEGISLIILIITIIVVIILAAVVVLMLTKNNPIESAKEARFKEDIRTFQDELAMYISKDYTTNGGARDNKITATELDKIKKYIPSFNKNYEGKLIIQDDELVYAKTVTQTEKEYLESLSIRPKGLTYISEGLILHLDGINNTRNGHSTTTTTWEDLSGNNNDFTKLSVAAIPKWSDKSYVGDGQNRALIINKALLEGTTECTVEVCYDVDKIIDYYWVFQSRQGGTANGFQILVSNTDKRNLTIFGYNSVTNKLANFTKVTDLNKRTMGFALDNSKVTFTDNATFYTEYIKPGALDSVLSRTVYCIGNSYPWNPEMPWSIKGNIY